MKIIIQKNENRINQILSAYQELIRIRLAINKRLLVLREELKELEDIGNIGEKPNGIS